MGRILVIHPHQGFLDMVGRILANRYEVEVLEHCHPAEVRLAAGAAYEAVLCGLSETAGAIRIFEKAASLSAGTRLIPIASDLIQLDVFKEQWNSDASRKQKHGNIGRDWLPERFTVGDIHALLSARAQESAPDSAGKQAVDNHVGLPEPDLPADQASAAGKTQTQSLNGATAGSTSAGPYQAGAEGEHGADRPTTLGIGTIIDGYQLVCSIGRGGFGAIWMCVNETSEKRLAIKFVEGDEQVSQELVALRKYVHVAQGNDDLIQFEHVNSDATRLWLVTPLADSLTGGYTADSYLPLSLAKLLPSVGHLPDVEAVRLALRMCRALLTLHRAGLLHGDVAPGNILRVNGRWVLADPGLVRFLGEQGICHNPSYYPDPKASHPHDDLYALGLVLWEMVSGIAEMVSGQDRMRLDGRMAEYVSRTDLPMAKLLCHAAAQNPEQRYMNAEEMLHDLEWVAAVLEQRSDARNSLYNLPRLRSLRTGGAPPPLGGVV